MVRWIAPALFLLAATPAFAGDEVVGFRVREWFARMSGVIEADDGSGNSTRIDLADDLGLGDRNLTHELQAYLRIPVVGRIYLGWWRAHDTGSETINRQIDFDGVTFNIGDTVNSEVTLDIFYLTYEFVFPTIPLGEGFKMELGAQLGVRGIRAEGSMDETNGGQSGARSGTVGFPFLGGHVTVDLGEIIRVEAELVGFPFSYGDWSMSYIEAGAEVVVTPLPWLFAGVGYKYVNLDVHHTGSQKFLLDVGVAGAYISVGVRF